MKTLIYFENEELSCSANIRILEKIRQLYPENSLILISAGDFASDGTFLNPPCRQRSQEYIRAGADLVLSLPVASVLGGYGKKEFAAAALVQRLRLTEQILLPCIPVAGQTQKDCESALRSLSMLMFKEANGYRSILTGYLNQNLSFREAQAKAVAECFPEHKELLSYTENRHALWMLDAMLQLYYMANVECVAVPANECPPVTASDSSPADQNVLSGITGLLETRSAEDLIDISGSTASMISALLENKEAVRAAHSPEQLISLLQPEAPDRIRLFLLKAVLGIRKIHMQICALHVFVPYCYISAENENKRELLKQLEEQTWVPFIGNSTQELKMKEEYYYLLQADKKVIF